MLQKRKICCCGCGWTGAVGTEMIATLEQRQFPVGKLRLFASEKSEGSR